MLNIGSLAHHSDKLLHLILDQLLKEGHSIHHAVLAGRLCAVKPKAISNLMSPLAKLRNFVFQQLQHSSHDSFSSHLTPFLEALSVAIFRQLPSEVEVTMDEMILLQKCAANSISNSLMEETCLKLMSILVQSKASKYFHSILQLTTGSYQMLIEYVKGECQKTGEDISSGLGNKCLGILASCSLDCARFMLDSSLLQSATDKLRASLELTEHQVLLLLLLLFHQGAQLEIILNFFAQVSHITIVKDWIGVHAYPMLFQLCSIESKSKGM